MQLHEAIENNVIWAAKRVEDDPMFFKRLASGQKPSILYIGCSDSRVTAEEMLGAGPGDLLVHRNIANSIENEVLRYRRLVELNVHEQCINLIKNAEVQNAYCSENLIIAGWVFEMATGRITDLELNIDTIVDSIRDIYSIAEKV
jgi:carbonic anhydrase